MNKYIQIALVFVSCNFIVVDIYNSFLSYVFLVICVCHLSPCICYLSAFVSLYLSFVSLYMSPIVVICLPVFVVCLAYLLFFSLYLLFVQVVSFRQDTDSVYRSETILPSYHSLWCSARFCSWANSFHPIHSTSLMCNWYSSNITPKYSNIQF